MWEDNFGTQAGVHCNRGCLLNTVPLNTGFAAVIVIGDRSQPALLVRLLQHGTFAKPGVGYSSPSSSGN